MKSILLILAIAVLFASVSALSAGALQGDPPTRADGPEIRKTSAANSTEPPVEKPAVVLQRSTVGCKGRPNSPGRVCVKDKGSCESLQRDMALCCGSVSEVSSASCSAVVR